MTLSNKPFPENSCCVVCKLPPKSYFRKVLLCDSCLEGARCLIRVTAKHSVKRLRKLIDTCFVEQEVQPF